tara:strand:- start:2275 stop:2676 length:402 start_codon:yes stop_codon:yes gene_type:complete
MNDSTYDNTNRGAAFKPFDGQQFILQGKLNTAGEDNQVALIMAESKDGSKRIEVFQKIGVLFNNDKQGNDKAPDYSGPIDTKSGQMRIAAWKAMKDDKPYMTFNVSEMNKKEEAPASDSSSLDKWDDADKIPF